MIKYRAIFIVALLIALLSACDADVAGPVAGSGKVVDQEVALRDFDRIEVGGAFRVDIRQRESYSVLIRVDDNLVRCLDVRLAGRTLHIGFKSECWVSRATAMESRITMPTLLGLELSGASKGTIAGFRSERSLEVNVSGASTLQGEIEAGDVTAEVSGASRLELAGRGNNLKVDASGASHVELSGFAVRDAAVEVSGASSATVAPAGRLDAQASGASRIYYLGNPTMGRIETSGGSSIQSK